jgi:hypothetical protein
VPCRSARVCTDLPLAVEWRFGGGGERHAERGADRWGWGGTRGVEGVDWKWALRVPVPGDGDGGDKRRIAGIVIADCGGAAGSCQWG